jgi:hypothetical protein
MIVVADVDTTSKKAIITNFNPPDTGNMKSVSSTKTPSNLNAWGERLTTKGVDSLNPCISVDMSSLTNAD